MSHPPAARVSRAPVLHRLAWFWPGSVVPSSRLPIGALALGISLTMWLMGLGVAAAFGEATNYLEDPRFAANFLILGVCALYAAWLPRAFDRVWTSVEPHLANPAAEVVDLRAETPVLLARFFPVAGALWSMFALSAVLDNGWRDGYDDARVSQIISAVSAPAFGYFVGLAFAFSSVGLLGAIGALTRAFDFKPGMLARGGRAVLRPFSELLSINLILLVLAMALISITNMPISGRTFEASYLVVWTTLLPPFMILFAIFLYCERLVSRMVSREKEQEVRRLRTDLDAERDLPPDANATQALRSLQRTQVILYDLQRTESFGPAVIDARIAIQIVLSVTGIILANVLLRTLLADLLPD